MKQENSSDKKTALVNPADLTLTPTEILKDMGIYGGFGLLVYGLTCARLVPFVIDPMVTQMTNCSPGENIYLSYLAPALVAIPVCAAVSLVKDFNHNRRIKRLARP